MQKVVRDALAKVVEDIDAGRSNLSEERCLEIMELIGTFTESKSDTLNLTETCEYLGVTRQTLNNWIHEGKIHPGRKRRGSGCFWKRSYLDKIRTTL